MLRPYLQQLEFDAEGLATRWFPNGPHSPIVLDPRRAFGMPIIARTGTPTEAIAALHRSGNSLRTIADWYRIDESEAHAAVAFESALARAA